MATSIVRLNPFEEMSRLQREVNRLFDDSSRSGNGRGEAAEPSSARAWAPRVDIYEDQNEIVVHAELAGLKQEDIDIELNGEVLTIRGERKFEDEANADKYIRIERPYGAFQRSFTIGVAVNQDSVNASYKDGILSVHLPKSEATKPKKVLVQAA
jgi:HSP20 family protein